MAKQNELQSLDVEALMDKAWQKANAAAAEIGNAIVNEADAMPYAFAEYDCAANANELAPGQQPPPAAKELALGSLQKAKKLAEMQMDVIKQLIADVEAIKPEALADALYRLGAEKFMLIFGEPALNLAAYYISI